MFIQKVSTHLNYWLCLNGELISTRVGVNDIFPKCLFVSILQMVLAGQKPEVVMEICSRALAFWTYQVIYPHL